MQSRHLPERRRKEIASLAKRKGRSLHNQMLVEGWRSVKSALLAGASLVELLATARMLEDQEVQQEINRLPAHVHFYEISEKEARQISSVESHQGIFAVAAIDTTPLDAFGEMDKVLALDGVQDPGNVGTIIRTAAWFGIEGVLAGAGTADFFNPKVIRASMGGIWDVKLAQVQDLNDTLASFRAAGSTLICADLEGTALPAWRPKQKTVLVIGSEANGVSEEVRQLVDEAITIAGASSKRGTESLNAATAAGIFMHYWGMGIGQGDGGGQE